MVVACRRSASVAMVALALFACSSSSNTNKNSGNSAGTGGGASGTTGGVTNPNTQNDTKPYGNDLQIVFSPMYSGFDGSRTFKVPAVVTGITGVKWSTTDISMVSLEDDATTGGVMITTKKAGMVKIIARAGMQSGAADLTINSYNSADCDAGDMRYNNGMGLDGGSLLQVFSADTPKTVSCHACHGDGAMALSVQHTPQQTGGWDDQAIINIATKGFKPDGSVFVTMFPPQLYQKFHQWQLTEQEKTGIVCYLRSLEPKSQGMLDFQGLRPPGGGMAPMGTMTTPPAGGGTAGSGQ